jgi:hypothetical protein
LKPIRQMPRVRITSSATDDETAARRVTSIALEYHHNFYRQTSSGPELPESATELERALAAKFFPTSKLQRANNDHLYVEDIEQIRSLVRTIIGGERKLHLVLGKKGSGKTTDILYLAHCLTNTELLTEYSRSAEAPYDDFLYLDVKYLDTALRNCNYDLCALAYTELYERYVVPEEGTDRANTLPAFLEFVVDTDTHFSSIRSLADMHNEGRPASYYAYLNSNTELRQDLYGAWRKWQQKAGIIRLRSLLKWVDRHLRLKMLLLVDNADQSTAEFQLSVGHDLVDLLDTQDCAVHSAVMSLREDSYIDLVEALAGATAALPHVTQERKLTPETLAEVLDRRLTFAAAFVDKAARHGDHVDIKMKYELNPARYSLEYLRQLRRDDAREHSDHLFEIILDWYNASARAADVSLFRFLDELQSERDRNLTIPHSARLTQNRRRSRTLLFRHLLLQDSAGAVDASQSLLYVAERTPGAMPFPELHVLIALAQGTDGVNYGMLQQLFVPHLLTAIEFDSALRRLARTRGLESEGFARIDVRDLSQMPQTTTRVELLDSGRLLLDWFAHSCEYLFWCAMYHDRGSTVLPTLRSRAPRKRLTRRYPTPELVLDEDYTAQVAVRFFAHLIVDPLLAWIEQTVMADSDRRSAYRDVIGTTPFFLGFANALTNFIVNPASAVLESDQDELVEILGVAASRLEQGIEDVRG